MTSNQKHFEDQFENENVLLTFRKHPIVMRREVLVASAVLLLGVIPSFFRPTFTMLFGGLAAGFVLAFMVMFYAWMGWYFSVYILTNQRFIQITQKGLWKRSFVDIGLNKVQTINYEVGGFQATLLGFGTIVIQTYVGELVIHEVHHPVRIQKHMSNVLRELGYHATAPPLED